MGNKKKNQQRSGLATSGNVATNRQARFRYEIVDKREAGIELQGTEVKSLRLGKVDLKDAYASFRDGELWLVNAHIAPYPPAALQNHEPERPRKLLLHRDELDRLVGQIKERGLTLVPTRIYFKNTRAKVEIGLGKGKEGHDKRRTIQEREQKREMERALKDRYR